MDLFSIKTVKSLLKEHEIQPNKLLGQNFLVSESAITPILKAADIRPTDTVLEIGSGIGTLTKELAKEAKKVIAIEKDVKMVEISKEALKDYRNVQIVQGDILKARLSLPKDYKVVANLPYYITSPVIRMFLESVEIKPERMVLMVQKEVGQRICAKPPDMSLLAVSVQFYANPKIISYVKKGSFWPQPKVDSAILKIVPLGKDVEESFAKLFFQVVKAGFRQPRKQLVNNLSAGLALSRQQTEDWLYQNGIKPMQRAETLSVEDWIKLARTYKIKE